LKKKIWWTDIVIKVYMEPKEHNTWWRMRKKWRLNLKDIIDQGRVTLMGVGATKNLNSSLGAISIHAVRAGPSLLGAPK
jgi:hypothetical protein